MKAISLWQPFASAIALGAKRIETRAWSTDYRGPLAIHAARTTVGLHLALGGTARQRHAERMETWIAVLGLPPRTAFADVLKALPLGAVVATCELVDVVPVAEVPPALLQPRAARHGLVREEDLGDFTPGRFAWVLDSVVELVPPLPWRGSQRLFDIELEAA